MCFSVSRRNVAIPSHFYQKPVSQETSSLSCYPILRHSWKKRYAMAQSQGNHSLKMAASQKKAFETVIYMGHVLFGTSTHTTHTLTNPAL